MSLEGEKGQGDNDMHVFCLTKANERRTETASSFFSWSYLNKRCGACRSHSVKGLCELEDIVVEVVGVNFVAA